MSDSRGTLTAGTEKGDPLVELSELRKYYDDGGFLSDDPVKAVDGVSLEIRKGETLGLVGESGCGKTTLGRTILQLEEATDGHVRAGGTDVTTLSGSDLREWQSDAQMVFQDPDSSLNDRMTVGEIVREPLDAHGWGDDYERQERAFEMLEAVGLQEEHFYRYPHQFSGGQRQRIGIARSLALKPEFVVLDEPVSALDVSVQARIINLLEELQDDLDLTYLFIAHDLSVVRHIADRVAVMYLGNVVELGETADVFTDPAHPYTASLLSAIPGSAGTDRERITLRGTPPSPRDPPSGCPFSTRCPAKIRPEGWEGVSEDGWVAIETFRAALRERSRAEEGLARRLKRSLGLDVGGQDVDELVADVFGDVSLPAEAREVVDEAADRAGDGDDEAALSLLRETFESECDREHPETKGVSGAGRVSRCLRHEDEFDGVGETLARRH